MADLAGEALLATVGIDRFIGEPKPIRITQELRERALGLPARWDRAIRKFLTADDWAPDSELPPFDFAEVSEALAQETSVEDLTERLAGAGDADMALSLATAATAALDYLRLHIPRRGHATATGPKESRPSALETARFRRIFGVVNRPEVVLDDLQEGDLTREQVQTLERVYPELYAFVQRAVVNQLTRLREEKPNVTLPRARDLQLQVLLQAASWNAGLDRRLQAAFASPEAPKDPAPAGGGAPAVNVSNEQTPVQRIAAK